MVSLSKILLFLLNIINSSSDIVDSNITEYELEEISENYNTIIIKFPYYLSFIHIIRNNVVN